MNDEVELQLGMKDRGGDEYAAEKVKDPSFSRMALEVMVSTGPAPSHTHPKFPLPNLDTKTPHRPRNPLATQQTASTRANRRRMGDRNNTDRKAHFKFHEVTADEKTQQRHRSYPSRRRVFRVAGITSSL